jgi:hypothetical protein
MEASLSKETREDVYIYATQVFSHGTTQVIDNSSTLSWPTVVLLSDALVKHLRRAGLTHLSQIISLILSLTPPVVWFPLLL